MTALFSHRHLLGTESLSAEEISEVLLHAAAYAGVPAANRAFELAREVIEENEPDPGPS